MASWSDMELLGWRRGYDENRKGFVYFRPEGQTPKKVYQKRNLTHQEKIDFGDVLFPGKVKFAKTSHDTSEPSTSAQSTPSITHQSNDKNMSSPDCKVRHFMSKI